jgi:hypothetical protein
MNISMSANDDAKTKRIETFEEFWPFYVGEHRNPLCRGLHYAGTSLAIGTVAAAALTLNPAWLLATPIVGYGPAWVAHYFLEGNRPASFRHPIWSFRADLKMLKLALAGEMSNEVIRLYGSTFPAPDAPLISHVAPS